MTVPMTVHFRIAPEFVEILTRKNPPLDTIYNFYLFDVDNAEEVLKTGAKPKLVEKGPFCYRNHNFKRNVTFHDDRHSGKFHQLNSFALHRPETAKIISQIIYGP